MAGQRRGLQGRSGPRRLAVPAAVRRQDPVQRPADRAGRRRNAGDRPLRGVAGPGGIRSRAARHRHASASAIGPYRRRPRRIRSRPCSCRRSRAARPTRRWPPPPCATRPNIHVPIEHHNPMELYASTVIVEGDGKLTVYDKTQGVQNVQQVSLRRVRHEAGGCARHVAVHGRRLRLGPAPAVPGGAGGARGARAAALGARRADAAADVWAGLSAGHDPAHRARRERRRNARRDHARRDHRDVAIRGLPPAGDRLVRPALQVRQREIRAQARAARSRDLVRHARAQRRHRRLCARSGDGRARGRAQARSARASPALLFGARPARGSALQQQGAARMLPPGRRGVRLGQAQPRAALDARRQRPGRLGHGDRRLGGAAGADHGAHRAHRQRPCRGRVRDLRHRHRHLHHHGAGRGRHARAAAREHQRQARRLEPAAIAGRRRIVDCGLGVERHRDDGRRDPRRAAAPGQADAEFPAGERRARRGRACRTASW